LGHNPGSGDANARFIRFHDESSIWCSGSQIGTCLAAERLQKQNYMVFNSDEIEIIEYLKSWKGEFVSVAEICRRAGGKRKFEQEPNWAKLMMARLVDAGVVEVNDRGHFGYCAQNAVLAAQTKRSGNNNYSSPRGPARDVGGDFFPETKSVLAGQEVASSEASGPQIIDEDYFPGTEEPLFTSISKPVIRTDGSPAPTVIDEDYFPAVEEPMFTSISKPTVSQDSGPASVIIDEDYFPASDESQS
jgi:hypothetical protein